MKRLKNEKWESVLIGFTACVCCLMLGWFLRGAYMRGVILVETERPADVSAPVASAQVSAVERPEAAAESQSAVSNPPNISPAVREMALEITEAPEKDNGKINLNVADAAELEELPGIGEVLAGRILEYRETNGSFSNVEELLDVDGIGEKTYEKIKDFVEVR